MNALLTRVHYRRLSTAQLRTQYRNLERDDPPALVRFELGEIYDVLAERGLRP
jgi:hypothetical protein